MKNQNNILTNISQNSTISNIQYPISNIQYRSHSLTLIRSFYLNFPRFFCFFSIFFVHLFLSACVDLATSSTPNATSKHTVSFQTDGGSAVPSMEVTSGTVLSQTITAPTKAVSGGTTYYFGDWYTVDAATGHTGKTKYDYTKPVTGNMTLYARWYTEQPADKAALKVLITTLGDTADLNHIDVRKVTDLSQLFKDQYTFNGDVSGWDVSNVKNMGEVFRSASAFSQLIGDWDVSGATNMYAMFSGATKFNQPIGDWEVPKVKNMVFMFYNTPFNQPIASWNVSGVENMDSMFHTAKKFNQSIRDWNVSGVVNMDHMFHGTSAFDQDISGWTVSQVTGRNMTFLRSGIREAYKPAGF
ncbi:BspA family leucine-rich repeat surface protein [Candidatus Haliotispira prima]|uniref:BspA family leucine-rich repeat surface protein n=1 Tax=Candidatus Haliotispira prima TaxID=3034016 RepID=A0ABY8MIM6_9SPIO|nr:BspA family leucine-rich repeat surface protein [Candidatus Haliotispira prima]